MDAILVSLDAKKAFDSVDHCYIKETLRAYGFGPMFIRTFETLYNKISAKILVNGFFTESIKIERGVKQSDALSCAIFIICIDSLLRNLNENKNVKEIRIRRRNGSDSGIEFKSLAYADDISVVCQNEPRCIQNIFLEYERQRRRSGLELNADKTEILKLNISDNDNFNIVYSGMSFRLQTVNKIKICGLYFCSLVEEEYKLNIKDKIEKLQNKMKLWSHRYLTMEGKTLIVKTFGLSQIIYNLQSYEFKHEDLVDTERRIFKFLWSTKDNPNGINRIKRSIMKNEYADGGMRVTDVECLDKSLKLKQFIRAKSTNHEIAKIQNLLTNGNVNVHLTRQEYYAVTNGDPICKSAQGTLNIITDYNRELYKNLPYAQYESDRNLINEVASTNLNIFFQRKNMLIVQCILKLLISRGITSLGELVQAYEYENETNIVKTMKLVLSSLPLDLINIAKCYNKDINNYHEDLKYILVSPETRKNIRTINVKELQTTLKIALKKTESLDVKLKLGINSYDDENITRFRKSVKNSKLRNIYFRLIHNDFFTMERMKKYKMTNNDQCTRCGQTENTRHLLWECFDANKIWKLYNSEISELTNENSPVTKYEDILFIPKTPSVCLVKIKIIQELIQINRPTNRTTNNIKMLVKNLIDMEKYNAVKCYK